MLVYCLRYHILYKIITLFCIYLASLWVPQETRKNNFNYLLPLISLSARQNEARKLRQAASDHVEWMGFCLVFRAYAVGNDSHLVFVPTDQMAAFVDHICPEYRRTETLVFE